MPTSNFYTANLNSNTKSSNILAGDTNEWIGYPAVVKVYAVSSAIGVKLSLFADQDLLVDDKELVSIGTTLNKSDHLLDSFEIEPGSRLSLFLRETAGVSTTDIITAVEIIPL